MSWEGMRQDPLGDMLAHDAAVALSALIAAETLELARHAEGCDAANWAGIKNRREACSCYLKMVRNALRAAIK